jgi:hypothetical protein
MPTTAARHLVPSAFRIHSIHSNSRADALVGRRPALEPEWLDGLLTVSECRFLSRAIQVDLCRGLAKMGAHALQACWRRQ